MKFLLIFLITIGSFLLCMFFINLKGYLKSPKFNKLITALIDDVNVGGDYEIWTIKWEVPSSLREKNPQGSQNYFFKFKHHKNFNSVNERAQYIKEKITQNIGNKFYLAARVDNDGVIRDVGKYDGYLSKLIGYGIVIVIFTGLTLWLY